MRDSNVAYDLFFTAINANSNDVSNATFDDYVKLCITFEVLVKFSALLLKNSAGLSLNSP